MELRAETTASTGRTTSTFAALALDRALRPQRILLSVATLILLALGNSAGGVELGTIPRVAVAIVAAGNMIWNLSLLRSGRESSERGAAAVRQIVVDATLALASISVVDAQSTPLAWILLLSPVLDAAARFALRGAILTWGIVSLAYITLLMAFYSADTTTTDLLSTGVQQVAAVAATVGPMLIITSRLRSDLESTSDARAIADDQRSQLRGVSYTAQQMGSATSPDQVLDLAMEATQRLGFARADICIREDRGPWQLHRSLGTPESVAPALDPLLMESMTRASVVSTGVSDPSEADVQRLHDLGYAAAFVVTTPVAENRWIGLRGYSHDAVRESSALFESLEAISSHTAAAWTNTTTRRSLQEWSRQLEHQAMHDSLTGLPNRASLLAELDVCVEPSTECEVSLLFLDLNGFKTVNDTLGHEAGDVVLQVVGQRLQNLFSGRAFVSRLGGDEFVVAAPTRDPKMLEEIAARVMAAIQEPIQVGGTLAQVGTSIGIAPHAGEARSALMHRADTAMYEAKLAGKTTGSSTFAFSEPSAVGHAPV